MTERDVGLGLLLDSDQTGRVFIEQLLPSSIAHKSGQVLPGDEIIEIDGVPMRNKHAREVKGQISSNQSSSLSMRLNRGGRIVDIKLPRNATGMSMSLPPSRDASASPSRSRKGGGGGNGGGDLAGIDAQVQRIMRNASDDEARQAAHTHTHTPACSMPLAARLCPLAVINRACFPMASAVCVLTAFRLRSWRKA